LKTCKYILIIIIFGFFYYNSLALSKNKIKYNNKISIVEKHLPETYDDAVDYLIKSLKKADKSYLKSFPNCDLIIFHFGWGMGIRNGLGLRSTNDKLLNSCAEKVGKNSIDPDEASFIIIEGIWEKLNQDILDKVDFNKIEPNKYFEVIWKIMQIAKKDKKVGYLASLPKWVYNIRRLNDNEDSDSIRNKQLLFEAKRLALENSEASFIGILYLVFFSTDINEVYSILDEKFKMDVFFIEIPSYYYNDVNAENLIIRPKNEKKIEDKKVKYNWNKLSLKEFAVKCYGSLLEKYFKSIGDFNNWKSLCKLNYLVRWKYENEITSSDYKLLIKEPMKLLKILTLTNQYFYFDDNNNGLSQGAYGKSVKSIENFIQYLGFKDSILTKYPYNNNIDILGEYEDSAYQKFSFRAINALSSIADKLTAEEIFEMLSPNAIAEYNKNYKTEGLADYKILGGFLLATQYNRIINYTDKNKAFEICYNYWKNEFISWPLQDYITELLFQINSKKALNIFLEYFKKIPTEGSFTRNGILIAIVKYEFADNKDFIENWYWTVYDKGFNYHPYEQDLILSLLKDKNAETIKLYNKIIHDKRFKK
jgi:hypothetical protein